MTNADGERGTGFRLSFRELGLGCGGRLSIGVGGQVRFLRSRGIYIYIVHLHFNMTSTEYVYLGFCIPPLPPPFLLIGYIYLRLIYIK